MSIEPLFSNKDYMLPQLIASKPASLVSVASNIILALQVVLVC